ncbi:RNA polymerase sigma-70 factor [Fulvivirgaceae bacterium BMA10]|uniref:RNA polymerase sigma-70 factor n=1 Tax=Splendidivirga corallicola TaxID=3051826 RepID=A0ABT8KS17_9BACT|nr:RNA polymerase sigma-70 factor [Fulvivirgaceae bacterium BMA10]
MQGSSKNIALEKLRRGDEASFKSLFDEFYLPLVKFANSYLFNWHEAEDVVQSVFIKIWEKANVLTIEKSFDAYLYMAVKNNCLNRLESIQIKDKYNILFVEALAKGSEENQKINVSQEEELRKAIKKLPPQIRKIIKLKYTQNKKISDISKILNISENSVKTQLRRGKSKLKMSLEVSLKTLALVAAHLISFLKF